MFFCPMCEIGIKIKGLRNGNPAQFIPKQCSACVEAEASAQTIQRVKNAVPGTPVFANTGVRLDNVDAQLDAADGAIIGTAFKEDGHTWNPIDLPRVKAIMGKVRELRTA